MLMPCGVHGGLADVAEYGVAHALGVPIETGFYDSAAAAYAVCVDIIESCAVAVIHPRQFDGHGAATSGGVTADRFHTVIAAGLLDGKNNGVIPHSAAGILPVNPALVRPLLKLSGGDAVHDISDVHAAVSWNGIAEVDASGGHAEIGDGCQTIRAVVFVVVQ